MKKLMCIISIMTALAITACNNSIEAAQQATPTKQPIATPQSTQTPIKLTPTHTRTQTSTKKAGNPVCSDKTENVPCVLYATIQDAAAGESRVGAVVHTGKKGSDVWVKDDITDVKPTAMGPDTTLNAIQFQCFNIQQALWYSLKSTINNDGSTTIIKSSDFTEVDITFIDRDKANEEFASCLLTSAGVDRIDKAGMWDDGDFVGAWALYDKKTFA